VRPDLGPTAIPEAQLAAGLERRWLEAHPEAVSHVPPPPPPPAPPPPGFLPPAGASTAVAAQPVPAERFAPLRVRSLLALRWLWFAVALGVVAFGVDVAWLREKASPDWTFDDLISLADLMQIIAIVQLVTYLIGAAIFLAWFYRAYGNLRVLGVPSPRHGKGWAIGSWFIPIANLLIPKQLANDVWRAGDLGLRPGDPAWQATPVSSVLHWWWAFWLLGNVANAMAGNVLADAETLGAFQAAVRVDTISQVLGLLSAFAAMAVIKRSTSRQEARARLLEAPGA
jgi:eukaryotic-like serine/threonine-protein kinase